MKIFSKQSYIILGRLFILLFLALCLFDFGVQGVAADNSVETSALVVEATDVELSADYAFQAADGDSGDTDGEPVDDKEYDFRDFIKWLIKKYPWWFELPQKSGYGWSD